MAIRAVNDRVPVTNAAPISKTGKSRIREISKMSDLIKPAVKVTAPAPAPAPSTKIVKKEEAKPTVKQPTMQEMVQVITQSLVVLAKGIQDLGEQQKAAVMDLVTKDQENSAHLRDIIQSLSSNNNTSVAKPKRIEFNITHRDDDGRIANFIVNETELAESEPDTGEQ